MTMLIKKLIKYIQETLNVAVTVNPWEESSRLPLFLQDDYAYYLAKIHGIEFLLMVDCGNKEWPPSIVGKHIDQLRSKWGGEVVYVREQVSSYIRKRLIDSGIQFIVPGNQLYLPILAIDLREYFRQKRIIIHKFSPATQVLALYWIYHGGEIGMEKETATKMAHILGYTKMTMSRAFKEIDAALTEIFPLGRVGFTNNITLQGRELWEKFQPYWRNPVSQRHYLPKNIFDKEGIGIKAGLTALASYSMLAEPAQDIYAVSQKEWRMFKQKHNELIMDQLDTQNVEVEVWSYPPNFFEECGMRGVIDPLSLYLTLKESIDERVEIALEELLGGIQW